MNHGRYTEHSYRRERYDALWSNTLTKRDDPNRRRLRLFCISDLHIGTQDGQVEDFCQLAEAAQPDLILIAGDLLTAKFPQKHGEAKRLLEAWAGLAPVVVSLGNHEQRWPHVADEWRRIAWVTVVDNQTVAYDWSGDWLNITGLTLPQEHFARGKRPSLTMAELCGCIGRRRNEEFHILLAHHPAYSRQYRRWGADLTFSGHYHGGLLRLPLIGGVLSPQLVPFPQYSKGCFGDENRLHVVTVGAGDHTGLPRWWNPKEAICIDLIKDDGRIRIDTIVRMESK